MYKNIVYYNMARRIATANEFFDILSSIKAGQFATIGYVTSANLNIPQVKRKNPLTNRMKSYDDYETFGKDLGHDNIGGVIKLTSFNLNWSNPDTISKAYAKYKEKLNAIKNDFGIPVSDKRGGYQIGQEYGDKGISLYGGDNDEKAYHSYTNQNTYGAKKNSEYYLVDNDGSIVREVNKDELISYFKSNPEINGVAALRKIGADEQRINDFISQVKNLKMNYMTFEASSILYMVATVNGEKIIYINDRLSESIKNIKIQPSDFAKIAKEKYKEDLNMLNEMMKKEDKLNKIISESINYVLENYFNGGYATYEDKDQKDSESNNKEDKRKADYKTETAKEKEWRNQVEEFFRSPGVNIAQYAYRLYGADVKEGVDTNDMKNARSRFMKCLNHEKNESGYPYSFTSPEINELYSLISSENKLSEAVKKAVKKTLSEGRYDNSPITKWVYWCFNYSFPQEWIPAIWGEGAMGEHMMKKFSSLYKQYGASAVMNKFFVELDQSNQEALINYVLNNY